jgi:hypothetical protein
MAKRRGDYFKSPSPGILQEARLSVSFLLSLLQNPAAERNYLV